MDRDTREHTEIHSAHTADAQAKDNAGNAGSAAHRKRRTPLEKAIHLLLSLAFFAAILFAGVLEILTLTEYRPAERESVSIEQGGAMPVEEGDTLKVLTWNCGYGALGDNADFFMDGGKSVYTADKERVMENLSGIAKELADQEADVIFLQEVDRDSARSRGVEETISLSNMLLQEYDLWYSSAFAYNFNVRFVPFPLPPIGRVRSGLMTFTGARPREAERVQLPNPFRWPVRLANFKRCLLVERIPIAKSDRELVLVNLHLEAYDDGEGKEAQTKMLRQILAEEARDGTYVIAGGDFNQTFDNADMSAYPALAGTLQPGHLDTAAFGPDWQCLTDSTVPTCRSLDRPYKGAGGDAFQYYVIDGFIVSSNIDVKSVTTRDLGFVCTDHNPVLMECVLK